MSYLTMESGRAGAARCSLFFIFLFFLFLGNDYSTEARVQVNVYVKLSDRSHALSLPRRRLNCEQTVKIRSGCAKLICFAPGKPTVRATLRRWPPLAAPNKSSAICACPRRQGPWTTEEIEKKRAGTRARMGGLKYIFLDSCAVASLPASWHWPAPCILLYAPATRRTFLCVE